MLIEIGPHTILRASENNENNTSLTKENEILQVFVAKRKQGYSSSPHKHLKKYLTYGPASAMGLIPSDCQDVEYPQNEVFVVQTGRILVKYYDEQGKYLDEKILYPGDVSITRCGGYHAVEFLEDGKLLEIKLGPYTGSNDDKEFLK